MNVVNLNIWEAVKWNQVIVAILKIQIRRMLK